MELGHDAACFVLGILEQGGGIPPNALVAASTAQQRQHHRPHGHSPIENRDQLDTQPSHLLHAGLAISDSPALGLLPCEGGRTALGRRSLQMRPDGSNEDHGLLRAWSETGVLACFLACGFLASSFARRHSTCALVVRWPPRTVLGRCCAHPIMPVLPEVPPSPFVPLLDPSLHSAGSLHTGRRFPPTLARDWCGEKR
jgi:hypothetical protein